VDAVNNKIDVPGETLDKPLVLSSVAYIVAATTSILATLPPSALAGRTIGFREVKVTPADIAEALKVKHGGKEPEITYTPVDKLKADFVASTDSFRRLAGGLKLKWAAGTTDAGNELWDGETKGYTKKSLVELFKF
jgi:hypothetical protein